MEQWNIGTWAAVCSAGAAVLGALGAVLRYLFTDRNQKAFELGWTRVGELEEEVRLLRIALHKATQRGNDGWTVSEILSLAMPLPLADRIRAVKQARMIAERSIGIEP